MKRLLGGLSLWILGVAMLASAVGALQEPERSTLFVAPDGSDGWSGRLPAPNRERTDGPLATPQQALKAARALRAGSTGPVTVVLRGGTYRLSAPIVLAPEDSGTEAAPLVVAAYRGQTPILSGGRVLRGWKPVSVSGRKLWAAALPAEDGFPAEFRALWSGGERKQRARHPDRGYLRVAIVPDTTPKTPWAEGQRSITYHTEDLPVGIEPAGLEGIEATAMCRWVESHLPVESVERDKNLLRFGKKSVFRLEAGNPYYLENSLAFLDSPGEWYLDGKSRTVYYMPTADEVRRGPDGFEATVPALSQLLRLEGKPEAGQFVQHIELRGLTFAHTEWRLPADSSGFGQAAVGVPGALFGEGVRHAAFVECRVTHTGGYAIELGRGCAENRLSRLALTDLGAGGIKLGETAIRQSAAERAFGNEVSDCRIADGGKVFHSGIGIWIGQSPGNRILHNEIRDFFYSALSIGWTWGYGPALAKENVVEGNLIHHIGKKSNGDGPILSDMAGIYTLGMQPGTVIRHNCFHDIAALEYGGWGIYFDEGSTQVLAEENLVYRTTHGGFHQHYGRENTVRNNIFAFARDAQLQATRPEAHLRFTFERNLVCWRDGNLQAGDFSDYSFKFDRNLYWREGMGEIRFGSLSWPEWRSKGLDEHSIIADPGFAAPEMGDFTLSRSSPALAIGFAPFNVSDAGPRPMRMAR
jgi:hypothetical protein